MTKLLAQSARCAGEINLKRMLLDGVVEGEQRQKHTLGDY